jgi:hypothetical protein
MAQMAQTKAKGHGDGNGDGRGGSSQTVSCQACLRQPAARFRPEAEALHAGVDALERRRATIDARYSPRANTVTYPGSGKGKGDAHGHGHGRGRPATRPTGRHGQTSDDGGWAARCWRRRP